MKSLRVCAFVLLIVTVAYAADQYNRQVSVTGGSPQRLSAVLATAGYAGTMSLDELELCNPSGAANTLYVGEPDVSSTNGYPVAAGGTCWHQQAADRPIDATKLYLRVATTQNVVVSLRSR